MKVLQINSVCGIRSTGRICTDIAQVLEKDGHECKIAYGREIVPDQYKKYSVRIGSNLSVKMHALWARIFDNTGFGSAVATKRFIKWVKKYKPDIIHLHNLHGYYINIKVLFKYLSKLDIPIVWTLHDCWAFTGHCSHFDFVNCLKWESGCHHCSQKKRYPKSVLFDRSKKNYELKKALFTSVNNMTIVTPSEWLKGLVEKSFLGKYPVEVIRNGIDLSVFKPTEGNFREYNGLIDKKIVLGVASSWDDRKGLDDFIELSKMLDDDYKVVLVGLSKEQLSKLPNNILGVERTNSVKELAEIYTASDVFVNLTYEDNYPTVNLEALACGTPVVTYRTGGSVESVQSDNVVCQGNLSAVVDKIVNVCNDKNLQVVDTAFMDKESKYLEYLELYKKRG